ncbi:alpha/beta hydrolase [Kribbella sp. NBC_01245]|uniref:alpha/beta fold hydrolase n=1 Tax=Kribbella sp. NBC_01245 TaxID=2903578 RepID=UPI002E2C75B9|nr:alpha/beta hydrolase [Kribbella sp. NBC_01245]
MDPFADVLDESLTRPDGRTVAWTRSGEIGGRPLLRLPGTPGSRYSLRADRTVWHERGLEVITTERPGFGRSTRLPGRGFTEHCDDLAAILDHLGHDRVHLSGSSGGGPHVLAFAARHPDRVIAATIVVGSPQLNDDEYDEMIELNASALRAARDGREDDVRAVLKPSYDAIAAGPLAGIEQAMATAPASDRELLADPVWRLGFARGIGEAFAAGMDGWVDETMATGGDWRDIDLAAIRTSLTWWHGSADRNCPIAAARRLVDRLPTATLIEMGAVGHFEPYRREPQILDELLAR